VELFADYSMLWNGTVWTSKVLRPIRHEIGYFGDVLPSNLLVRY